MPPLEHLACSFARALVPTPPLLSIHVLVGALAACSGGDWLDTEPAATVEGARIEAFAHDMSPRALDELPHRPVLRVRGVWAADSQAQPSWLLAGAHNHALLDDLARKPLTKHHERAAIPADVSVDGPNLWLVPTEPLQPSAEYTLALGAWLSRDPQGGLPLPLVVALRTQGVQGGARLLATLPAAGQVGVPTDLPRVLLAWRGALAGCDGLQLTTESGGAVSGRATRWPCARLEDRADHCCAFELGEPLAGGHRYRLDASALRDAHGAPVAADVIDFAAASNARRTAPELAPISCAVDEVALAQAVCGLPGEDHVELRISPSEPVIASVDGTAPDVIQPGATRLFGIGEHTFALPAAIAGRDVVLRLRGVGGQAPPVTMRMHAAGDLPTVSITEVLANPLGKEPDQEFVELWNFGTEPVDIGGFTLADTTEALGSLIDPTPPLAPDARVLLVADGFQAGGFDDAQVPPGARLIRMGRALANNGLSNTGEGLYLRDAEGRRLSAAPARPKPRAGVCLVRKSDDGRRGLPTDFHHEPGGSCTPGRAP